MTPSSPRLLFLCHTLPYPPDGGVWIRAYHILCQLARDFDVTVLCFERTGSPRHDPDTAVQRLSEVAPTEAFPVPQEERPLRKAFDHAASLATGRVFTVYKHRSRSFRNRLNELLEAEDFDLVHVDSLDLAVHLPIVKELPVVLGHHNVESQLLDRRAQAEENPLIRWYVGHQAELQRREEERWCPVVNLNVTVSEDDRQMLKRIAPGSRATVVPNGVDVKKFSPDYSSIPEQKGLVFVGGAGWFPNRDGMEYFAEAILPLIRERAAVDVPATWVGGTDGSFGDRFEREHGIKIAGYVDDIRPYVSQAACFVVPLRVGGGSRLKILDAWAMGKAVVSTSVGCEGLSARDGDNILVRDEPEAFARAVVNVLEGANLRERLGRAARRTAVGNYSWEKIGTDMNRVYHSLVE